MTTTYSFRIGVLLLLCVLTFSQSYGQQRHELSAHVSGVFASLQYKVHQGKRSGDDNMGVGLAYAYFLNEYWSLGLGLEYQTYNTRMLLQNFEGSQAVTDSEGDAFEFRYRSSGYKEQQEVSYLNIPLTVSYQTKGQYTRFYASAGVQLGLALASEYQSSISKLRTGGYYPEWNAFLEAPKFMGFGNFGDQQSAAADLELDNSYSLLAEVGIKQLIGNKSAIYLGVFITYGLNTINTTGDASLVEYSLANPGEFLYNPVFNSTSNSQRYTDDVRTFATGVKLRYGFGW
ncbi:hypothetical protein [Sinomicrobium sp.]